MMCMFRMKWTGKEFACFGVNGVVEFKIWDPFTKMVVLVRSFIRSVQLVWC